MNRNADLSDQELVDKLNAILAGGGWTSSKGERLMEVRAELIRRGLKPPIDQTRSGVVIFGHARRYAIIDGVVHDVTHKARG